MDQWIQKMSLAAVLVMAVVSFYGSSLDVSCWTPAEFTSQQNLYSTQSCSSQDTMKYKFVGRWVPERNNTDHVWSSVIGGKTRWLLKLLLIEAILVCSVYNIIKGLVSAGSICANNPHNLHDSYSKTPFYLVIQISACFWWILFAILTIAQNNWSGDDKKFLCDVVSKFVSHTLLCMEQGEGIIRAAVMANFGLCLVVSLAKFVHIMSAFIIQPLLSLKSVASMLVDNNVIKTPKQLDARFALSDLHFAMLTCGNDIKFNRSKEEKENLMHD